MQIENDYDKEVYNGDIGYMDDIKVEDGELTVSYDGRSVNYGFGELWRCSAHAQDSHALAR